MLPWSPGLEDAENFFRREHSRDRIEAAGQRLADNDDVRADAFVHVGEKLAGAAQARLDFIRHEEHAVLAAEVSGFSQETCGRNDDAGLALDGLDQKRAGVRCDRIAQGARVTVRNRS